MFPSKRHVPPMSSLLSKSLAGASSLVVLQLLSRIVTFALNQALVRLASPAVFGTANIQFELLLSTILFLSREGVRNALLRSSSSSKNARSIANIALIPPLLGIPIAILSTATYLSLTSASTSSQPHFTPAVLIYALSAIVELASEPGYVHAQNELRFGVRVRAEGLGVILKAGTTVAMIVAGGEEMALVGFAVGQLAYASMIYGSFWLEYGFGGVVPKKVVERVHGNTTEYYFDSELLKLSMAMTAQSVVKHLLTEGDKFIVSRISSLEDQGGYAVASNYGSLVARIIFQPIEETSRLYFSKSLSSPTSTHTALTLLILTQAHLALILLSFAPHYLTTTLLPILLPQQYLTHTSAPAILNIYIPVLLPTMGLNGVLEAFFSSVASPADLANQTRFLIGTSAVCGASVYVFSQYLEKTALVWANALNLGLRALWAFSFAKSYFGGKGEMGWRKALPPDVVCAAFATSSVVIWVTAPKKGTLVVGGLRNVLADMERIRHFALGAVLGVACLGVCYWAEKHEVLNAVRELKGSDKPVEAPRTEDEPAQEELAKQQ